MATPHRVQGFLANLLDRPQRFLAGPHRAALPSRHGHLVHAHAPAEFLLCESQALTQSRDVAGAGGAVQRRQEHRPDAIQECDGLRLEGGRTVPIRCDPSPGDFHRDGPPVGEPHDVWKIGLR